MHSIKIPHDNKLSQSSHNDQQKKKEKSPHQLKNNPSKRWLAIVVLSLSRHTSESFSPRVR